MYDVDNLRSKGKAKQTSHCIYIMNNRFYTWQGLNNETLTFNKPTNVQRVYNLNIPSKGYYIACDADILPYNRRVIRNNLILDSRNIK